MSGMAEITVGGQTRVSWVPSLGAEPIDLSSHVTMIRMQHVPDPELPPISSGWFEPMTFRGPARLTPAGYRLLFGISHPRIRRMHIAYSRRRGKGRW